MTDAEVTHRVEQAMLGAMMARPRSAAQLGVSPEHFADARHQAIAATLTGTEGTRRGLFGRIREFFTRHSRATRQAAQYMDTLPDLCPEPAHITTYLQMLSADREQRAVEAQARVQAQGNQVLDVAAERLGQMRGQRPDPSTGMPRSTARLARALRDRPDGPQEQTTRRQWRMPWTRRRTPSPAQDQSQPQAAAPQAQVPRQGDGQPAQAAPGPVPQTAQDGRSPAPEPAGETAGTRPRQDGGPALQPGRHARPEDIQDAILAAMMRHPDEAREVTGWLTQEAFTGQRRELYTLIRQYDSTGRDIDPVTLAWGAAQPAESAPDGQRPGSLRPEFVLGLGRMDTAPGTASVLGKILLADQVVTRQLGPDWHLAQRTQPASSAQQSAGTGQPDPAQSQAQQQSQARQQNQGQQAQQKQQAQNQNQAGPQTAPAGAAAKNQGQPGQQGNGPYRQARPGTGTRPPARAGAGPATPPTVPGTLIQQPPPAPGQGGMSPNR